jgi:hypothetical protein
MRVNLPKSLPTAEQLAPVRAKLGEHLRDLSRVLMARELELTGAHEPLAFAAALRKVAEELSTAAATWARLSDSIRDWHV